MNDDSLITLGRFVLDHDIAFIKLTLAAGPAYEVLARAIMINSSVRFLSEDPEVPRGIERVIGEFLEANLDRLRELLQATHPALLAELLAARDESSSDSYSKVVN